MKDAVATMGMILPDDAGGRDAVHVAVVAALATFQLMPGQDVEFNHADGTAGLGDSPIGIVDPFLKAPVNKGQRFWLYLYPRTITGLSHKWSHPAFPDDAAATVYNTPSQKLASEQWLKDFTGRADCPGYHAVMALVEQAADGGSPEHIRYSGAYENAWVDSDYMHFNGSDAHGEIPDEFWRHAEIVIGRPVRVKPKYFSCSC